MTAPMDQRMAVIDLGTNTFKLLILERAAHGLRPLHSVELPVFLGRGGIEQGMIAEDAFRRGLEALRQLRATALEGGARAVRGFGTSALRNANNADRFVQLALEQLGIPITIIPGDREAELILEGVRQAVSFSDRPALVMDIGGGSTEFILATGKALMWKRSFELGVTRLRERFPTGDPMSLEEEARIAQHLDARLEALWAIIDRHAPHRIIGSAGSFDTLAAMLAQARDTPIGPDTTTLDFTAMEFETLKDQLMRMSREERLRVPGLPEHRVDTVIHALIQIERAVLAGGIRELSWSRYSLKEGAAKLLAEQADGPA